MLLMPAERESEVLNDWPGATRPRLASARPRERTASAASRAWGSRSKTPTTRDGEGMASW